MIVQPASPQAFVIEQTDHARMSGQLARAFGNAHFVAFEPREPIEFIVAHHDEGWLELDAQAKQDPKTGLPFNLTQTPLADLVATGSRSPNFNERHHSLSGLISSMHTWGLYHGRYGLSDFLFIDRITLELRPTVDAMLNAELERQARLKAQLPELSDAQIFSYYKLLQFFDTLALYFHTTPAEARKETQFKNVPRAVGDDVTVTITPQADGSYALTPYPFASAELRVSVEGRYLPPQPANTDLVAVLQATPKVEQEYLLVS
ncbi:MAG: DUF3891 family protein [Anaerolineales bacterium]|nr:DUF3891 family protein [Anaerolineales bacterium]